MPAIDALVGGYLVDIGFAELKISSWSLDYQRLMPFDLRIIGDTDIAIPLLTKACRRLINRSAAISKRITARGARITKLHNQKRAEWRKAGTDARLRKMSPIPHAVLA